jgi:hypothetical protein
MVVEKGGKTAVPSFALPYFLFRAFVLAILFI